ncbi:hypothetical protein [uncultured Clostridium sp.]|uniref:hypothetical protein n=1 Tax=uncultured Clostridium sp. TaxID=59620 RepID=UPI0028E96377|nr:hypothetical protein [uncultured Clostridium sp.]
MQIDIVKLCQCESEGIFIEFSSQYGVAKGLWKGNTPEINQSYYVELDIRKTLIWEIDIIETDCREYKMWSEQDNIFFNVKMESYENDGCLTVRLGDNVILIETEGIPYSEGSFLKLQVNKILIYPYDL